MVVTAEQVYALSENNMDSSNDRILMRFDFTADPAMNNDESSWYQSTDNFTNMTAHDMTQAPGPLGSNGPLGAYGPLGYIGPLGPLAWPGRSTGTRPTDPHESYDNNWCPVSDSEDDDKCVYGSHGPLGSYYSFGVGCPLGVNCSDLYCPLGSLDPLGLSCFLGLHFLHMCKHHSTLRDTSRICIIFRKRTLGGATITIT